MSQKIYYTILNEEREGERVTDNNIITIIIYNTKFITIIFHNTKFITTIFHNTKFIT